MFVVVDSIYKKKSLGILKENVLVTYEVILIHFQNKSVLVSCHLLHTIQALSYKTSFYTINADLSR